MKEKIINYCNWTSEISLYFIFFFLPFAKAGIEIFAGIAIVSWIVKNATVYKFKINRYFPATELNIPIGAFVLVNLIAVFLTINFRESIRGFFGKTAEYVLLYFVMVDTINSMQRLRRLLTVMLASISLILIDAIFQYFFKFDFFRRSYLSISLTASFSTPNEFGAWLSFIIFFLLGIFFAKLNVPLFKENIKKIITVTLLIVSFVSLVFTYRRGAWLGFSLGLIFFFIYYLKSKNLKKKTKGFFAVLIFVCTIIFYSFLPFTLKERVESIGKIEGTNLHRVNLWKEAVMLVNDFPFFGTGLNTYSKAARYYKIEGGGGIYPHNSFLHMAAEIGILGLASFLWIIFRLFKTGLNALRNNNDYFLTGLLAGILAFLAHSFFDTNLYALQLVVLFWYAIGLTAARMKLGLANPLRA